VTLANWTASSSKARRAAEKRERGYREQALKIYPWICGRCAREFTRANVRELQPIGLAIPARRVASLTARCSVFS
jgi:hypothetical protein